MRLLALVFASMILALADPNFVSAQEHNHSHAAAHGGQVKKIGAYEAELVVKGADVQLYLLDDKDRKVDAARFSATAVVLARGNEQKTIELKYVSDNLLSGRADFPIDDKFRATLTLKSGSTETGKARYSLDAVPR